MKHDLLEKNSRYDLIGSFFDLIDKSDKAICSDQIIEGPEKFRETLPRHNCLNHHITMFRNNTRVSLSDKLRYFQDYEFCITLLSRNYIIGNISIVLLREWILPSSITYAKKDSQMFYKNLAKQFYFEKNGPDRD